MICVFSELDKGLSALEESNITTTMRNNGAGTRTRVQYRWLDVYIVHGHTIDDI